MISENRRKISFEKIIVQYLQGYVCVCAISYS